MLVRLPIALHIRFWSACLALGSLVGSLARKSICGAEILYLVRGKSGAAEI